jgi:hemolysin type calcium-binding protein/List-Bact-rpt repeat protein
VPFSNGGSRTLPSVAAARLLAIAFALALSAGVATAAEARVRTPSGPAEEVTLELILTGNEGAVAVSGQPTCDVSDTRDNGRPCSYVVTSGQDLTLTPQGNGFVGWSVYECPGTGPCTIDVDSDRTVVATFTPTSLSVSVEGSDLLDASGTPFVDGRVTSADGRVDCAGSNDCKSKSYPAFAEVVLTAAPAAEFERWSGACEEAGTAPTCTVLLSGDDVVGAKFRDDPDNPQLIPPRMRSQLRVTFEPAGAGTVRSSRSRFSEAIACDPECEARFQQGEKVTLEAVANEAVGARFVEWRGGAPYCVSDATCRSFPAFNITSIRAVFAFPGPCERRRAGTRGRDLFDGGPGGDRFVGGAGADRLRGHDGDDCIDGGAGNDRLEGGNGNDRLNGGAGNDALVGGPGTDTIAGGAGNDVIAAQDGEPDTINCGAGRDTARVDRVDRVAGCERVFRLT